MLAWNFRFLLVFLFVVFYFSEAVHLIVIRAALSAVPYLKMKVRKCRLFTAVFSVDLKIFLS